MISEQLQQQISHLCSQYPPAKPVIDAIIESFNIKQGPSQLSLLPNDALEYNDMSMILPSRRKCNVHIHDKGVWMTANGAVVLEFQWSEIIRAACLPVPDKPKPTWNLIFSREDPQTTVVLALGQTSADKHKANSKPGPLKNAIIADVELHSSLSVETQFAAQIKAYIGSKEGYLYLLDDALIYGHKKPILLLLHQNVASFSFTVITRNTFNVVVKMKDENQYEFSMIEQDDFPKISDYVSAHGLNDESLAEDRAAKRSRPDDLADEINQTGAVAEGRDDDDDRESDLDVEFSDRELDSDGSGLSEDEDDEDEDEDAEVDLYQTNDVDNQIDAIQAQQLDDQLDDEQDEEQGFNDMDAWDTNVAP